MYYNLLLSLFLGDAVFILGECLMFRLQCPRKLSCYIKIKHVNSAKPYSNRVVECCLYRLFGRFIPGFFHVIYRKIVLCVRWFIFLSFIWLRFIIQKFTPLTLPRPKLHWNHLDVTVCMYVYYRCCRLKFVSKSNEDLVRTFFSLFRGNNSYPLSLYKTIDDTST